MPVTRDYTALQAPVTRAEIAEFRRQAKASGRFFTQANVATIVIVVVFAAAG